MQYILWTEPNGRRVIPVEHVERLLTAGIIEDLVEAPVEAGNRLVDAVARGDALYRLVESFDTSDYTLAIDTLTREAARAKEERVLDALRASTPPEVQ